MSPIKFTRKSPALFCTNANVRKDRKNEIIARVG